MGWSLPEVTEKEPAPSWSPWICLLIIILGLFIGLLVAVLKSPTTGLPSLSSGAWLPLTAWTFAGISAAIAVYSFCQETLAIRVWNWNEWCRNTRLKWRLRAHQHLVILSHVFIAADTGVLSRLAHIDTQEGDSTDTPHLTLLPDAPLSQWVPDKVNSQGLNFNPAFLRAINQLSQLSDILFTDGSQGISFELQARPVPQVVETQLTIDGQKLHYFNQMADWQSFRWPGETYKPGTMLTWTTVNASARLFGDYSGTWGFIRWLDLSKRQQLDRSQWMMSFTAPDGRTLQWVLRSQLGKGPLALLDLRGFTLPDHIFSVDSAATAQALMANTENNDMEGVE